MTHRSISGTRITVSIFVCLLAGSSVLAQSQPLIVVEDHGGISALPFYQALDLPPKQGQPVPPITAVPATPRTVFSEADMLPVRSDRLSQGDEPRRVIQAPGLTPMFLVGDDERSRAWLRERGHILRDLNAVGLVVNVETAEALANLRKLAGSLTLSPSSGDDLAGRLGLRHYPVLITATGIEQ
ncbi:integrating conjugative element protein [Shinella sumterensis]|uniref:Integrating conjugative element protein (TIGR03765 family) n=1 Tax=Rhizobium subbaraonis TaxID=908946 RepID=A0A285USA5_9HYPH|nr:integrating conjugative element protein [Rhizobium subbaraonis]WLS08737.1 integrating conjugative element protein [Shinella sumterensis]SOC44699.1 integrating conjugative element protein (TIGR03765 family) [Rhizobium subbaraonis]